MQSMVLRRFFLSHKFARSFACLQQHLITKENCIFASQNSPRLPIRLHIQNYDTISVLAEKFNTKIGQSHFVKALSLLTSDATGLFCIEKLRTYDGFYLIKEAAIEDAEALIKEGSSPHRKRKMVQIFDDLSDTLCRVADMAEFIRMSHPEYEFADAAEDACLTIGGLVEKLNTDRQLYDVLKKVVAEGDIVPTSAVDNHVSKLFLFDFEQCGIHLDEEKRKRVTYLNKSILRLGQHFLSDTSKPRSIPRNALPPSLQNQFLMDGDKFVVSGYLSDVSSEYTREAAYKAYLYPDPFQEERLCKLLSQRQEMAQLCGFPSFSHRALRGSLAETPELVNGFLSKAAKEIRAEADEEFEVMIKMKKDLKAVNKDVAMWDVPFLTSVAKKKLCATDEVKNLSSYFSLGSVMEGINNLIFEVFGIYINLEHMLVGETWSTDVHKLAVHDSDDSILGFIYCDFFERNGKPYQDCHFTIQGGRELDDGKYQNPIVVLHLNLPRVSPSTPSLLSLSQVENLFHEMGHAIHSMLARTKYQHVTGTRCCTDFAEVPSILMEYFANDARVLHKISTNLETGETLPIEVIERLLASKSVFSAIELQLQTCYAKLDQCYHGPDISFDKTSTTEVLQEVQSQYYSLPYVANTAWQLRFGHLVGYGAKYYSYLMSRAVASWIWQSYFEKDPFNRDMGEKMRREVLIHGGGKPPRDMVEEFLGKQITPDNLVSALVNDIQKKKERLSNILK